MSKNPPKKTFVLEYNSWRRMKQRCYDPNKDNYQYYGGKGITVSPEWINDFHKFYIDMGPCPSAKHSLERIDGNKSYSKENCCWATQKEQCRNKQNNVYFELYGVTLIERDWAKIFEISFTAVIQRTRRRGWDTYRALTTPLRKLAKA